jgi:hypothetical protein
MGTPAFKQGGAGGGMFGMNQPNFGQSAVGNMDASMGNKVLEVYKSHSESETGLSFNDALRLLNAGGQNNMSMNDLRKIVDGYSNEGILYTTIDDMHYKSTD